MSGAAKGAHSRPFLSFPPRVDRVQQLFTMGWQIPIEGQIFGWNSDLVTPSSPSLDCQRDEVVAELWQSEEV